MNVNELQKQHLHEYCQTNNYELVDDGIEAGNLKAVVKLPNGSISSVSYKDVTTMFSRREAEAMMREKHPNIHSTPTETKPIERVSNGMEGYRQVGDKRNTNKYDPMPSGAINASNY